MKITICHEDHFLPWRPLLAMKTTICHEDHYLPWRPLFAILKGGLISGTLLLTFKIFYLSTLLVWGVGEREKVLSTSLHCYIRTNCWAQNVNVLSVVRFHEIVQIQSNECTLRGLNTNDLLLYAIAFKTLPFHSFKIDTQNDLLAIWHTKQGKENLLVDERK